MRVHLPDSSAGPLLVLPGPPHFHQGQATAPGLPLASCPGPASRSPLWLFDWLARTALREQAVEARWMIRERAQSKKQWTWLGSRAEEGYPAGRGAVCTAGSGHMSNVESCAPLHLPEEGNEPTPRAAGPGCRSAELEMRHSKLGARTPQASPVSLTPFPRTPGLAPPFPSLKVFPLRGNDAPAPSSIPAAAQFTGRPE